MLLLMYVTTGICFLWIWRVLQTSPNVVAAYWASRTGRPYDLLRRRLNGAFAIYMALGYLALTGGVIWLYLPAYLRR